MAHIWYFSVHWVTGLRCVLYSTKIEADNSATALHNLCNIIKEQTLIFWSLLNVILTMGIVINSIRKSISTVTNAWSLIKGYEWAAYQLVNGSRKAYICFGTGPTSAPVHVCMDIVLILTQRLTRNVFGRINSAYSITLLAEKRRLYILTSVGS